MNSLFGKILIILAIGLLFPTVLAEGNAQAGVAVYIANCSPCHGNNLEGTIGPALKDNSFVSDSEEVALVEVVSSGLAEGGMPAFIDEISSQEIEDVVALLKNPGIMPTQSKFVLSIRKPDTSTDDILPGIFDSLVFVFIWTAVAIIGLLAWINHKH